MSTMSDNVDYFEFFPWNHNLETGLDIVDEQHKQLVYLLNKLASYLAHKNDTISLNEVFAELAAYADYHFKTEEQIWNPVFGDDPWYTGHKYTHDSFMVKVGELKAEEDAKPLAEVVANILKFLTHWLAYHILDSDKRMAKVVLAVRNGFFLEKAKELANEEMSGSMQLLIDTVLEMYDNLSERTLELLKEKAERERIEKALEASRKTEKAFNDAVMQVVPGMLYLIDEHLRLIRWNDKVNELTGFSSEEVENKHILEFFAADSHQAVMKTITEIFERGSAELEESIVKKDGSVISCLLTGTLLESNGHQFISGIGIDISSRKKTEVHLIQSEAKYRSLFEESRDMMHIVNCDGIVVDVNRAELDTLDYSRDDMVGRSLVDFICPEFHDVMLAKLKQVFNGQAIPLYESALHSSQGECVAVEVSAFPQFDDHGNVVASRAIIRDIRERKEKEKLLLRRERQLSVLAEAGREMNEQLNEIEIGRRLISFASKLVDCESGAVGFFRDGMMCFHEYMKSGESMAIALDFPANYGVPGHVLATKAPYYSDDALHDPHVIPEIQQKFGFTRLMDVPILDSAGQLLGCFEMHDRHDGAAFDEQDLEMLQSLAGMVAAALVNARQHALIEASAEHMRHILDAEFDAVIVYQDFKIVFVNEAARKLFGFATLQETLGHNPLDYMSPQYRSKAERVVQAVIQRNSMIGRTEMEAFRPATGETFPIEIATTPIKWNESTAVMSVVRDISERVEREQEMRLLESAVGSINESILITNLDGKIVYVNSAFSKITGYTMDEALAETPAMLNSKQQPQSFYEQFWQTIKTGQPWSSRILDRKKDGTIFPVHLSVAPICNAKGEITHYVAVHEDLTKEELVQKKMMESQKMEAVGTMVGGLAHDFNNLLASMVGNLYLMRHQHAKDKVTVKRIDTMESALHRGAEMIRQMLTFARKDISEMHTLDLKTFIKESCRLARGSVPENIRFSVNYPSDEHIWVQGDATQLQQIILNLIANATHAVKEVENAEIIVELVKDVPNAELLKIHSDIDANASWCKLSCRDNGSGIDPEHLNRIFEPFFTTKGVGEGTGLGLSMVFGAVRNHRGFIDLDSQPGHGTSFAIWLPLQKESATEVIEEAVVEVDGSGKVVLVVDDQESLRNVLAEVLRDSNFQVILASDGVQAVTIFEQHQGQIDLIVMDVVMPNKGGVVAAQEIRALDADVPIIFQTGYGEQTQLIAAASISGATSLQKPTRVQQLLKLIATKLNAE